MPEIFSSGLRPVPCQSFLYAIRFILTGHLKSDKNERFEYDQSVSLGLLCQTKLPILPEWSVYVRLREYSVSLELIGDVSLTADSVNDVKKCHYAIFDDVIGFGGSATLRSLENIINDTLFAVPVKMVRQRQPCGYAVRQAALAPVHYLIDWLAVPLSSRLIE